jgi:thiol-disulfide isomerase/thioredoxin
MRTFLTGLWLLALPLVAHALARGDAAPDIWGKRMDNGVELKLSQLRGKIVYVDFWATWCAPCRVSLPLLNQMRKDFAGRGFEVLGVDIDKDDKQARKVMQALGIEYPSIRVEESTYEWYDVSAMPSAYVVDRKGKVKNIYRGFHKDEFPSMRDYIEKLLQEDAK